MQRRSCEWTRHTPTIEFIVVIASQGYYELCLEQLSITNIKSVLCAITKEHVNYIGEERAEEERNYGPFNSILPTTPPRLLNKTKQASLCVKLEQEMMCKGQLHTLNVGVTMYKQSQFNVRFLR